MDVEALQQELATASAEQYVATLDRALTTLVTARPAPDQQAREQFAAAVRAQQHGLEVLATVSAAPLRPALDQAIAADGVALDRSSQPSPSAQPAAPPSPTAATVASPAPRPAVSPAPLRSASPSAVASPSPVRP